MKMEIKINPQKMLDINGDIEHVYKQIKNMFITKGLICERDDDTLEFSDAGSKDDYGNMWSIVFSLVKIDWFLQTAERCFFHEDDYSEDILAQAAVVRGEAPIGSCHKKVDDEDDFMRFEIALDEDTLNEMGMHKEQADNAVKNEFLKRGISCSKDGNLLEFIDNGSEHDYANMWNAVVTLIQTDWFCLCASRCVFYEDKYDKVGEDVLAQTENTKKLKDLANKM